MTEKDRGRTKRSERAQKWQRLELITGFVSDNTKQRLTLWVNMIAVCDEGRASKDSSSIF